MESDPSIVEYFAEHEGYRCGYCKSTDTNFSHGMWAHQLQVQDYEDLIDRGWRRSGKYCYKPTMNRTCCPMYTIKCNAADFKISKSQRKVIKLVNRFLITGKRDGGSFDRNDKDEISGEGDVKNTESMLSDRTMPKLSRKDLPSKNPEGTKDNEETSSKTKLPPAPLSKETTDAASSSDQSQDQPTAGKKPPPRPGSGADPSKPVCRKAKELRAERRQQKLTSKSDAVTKEKPIPKNVPKSLEDLLNEPDQATQCAHKLEIRLCRSSPKSESFLSSFSESHHVFRSYQMVIHRDSPDECKTLSFTGFLVDSPLEEIHKDRGPSMGYGSFHQQYLLDGKIIAVGVIDILPTCVSSVYLYYDPGYSFLTLGVYSALREIAFVRELARTTPELHNYYMGFYIHSCIKMRYKGNYYPSFLSCPETYNWIPIEKCRPKLEKSKYSRLEEEGVDDKDKIEDVSQVLVLHKRTAMPYTIYTAMTKGTRDDQAEVKEYANFAGKTCAERMLLVRK